MTSESPRANAGQIIVIFALGLIAIALTVGLVVDGGMAFLQRRDGQNDADLAALAGTKVIADAWIAANPAPGFAPGINRGAVFSAIDRRMTDNGCSSSGGSPCAWTAHFVGSGASDLGPVTAGDGAAIAGSNPSILGVRVDVTLYPRTFFLGLVGQSSWRIANTATALTAKPSSAPPSQLLPLALHEPTTGAPFQAGQVYSLVPDKIAPGGFAWINWTASSRRAVADSACAPNNPSFSLTGSKFARAPSDSDWSRLRGCMTGWMKSRATVLVPIYSEAGAKPPMYSIVNIAAFRIDSLDSPELGDVQATFVGTYVYPAAPTTATSPPSAKDSLYYLGLVR